MQLKKTDLLVIGSILFVCLLVIYFGISMSPRDTPNVKAIQKKHFASTLQDVVLADDDSIIDSDIDDINQLMTDVNEIIKENQCIRSIVDQCDVKEDGTRDCEHLVCCGSTKKGNIPIDLGDLSNPICDSDGIEKYREWNSKCPTKDQNNYDCTPEEMCAGTCSRINPLFHIHHADVQLVGPGAGYSSGH
tara:strand:- start:886 stop:1455 length:570 start_codon:yes stop_codon:yes gene_type:complete